MDNEEFKPLIIRLRELQKLPFEERREKFRKEIIEADELWNAYWKWREIQIREKIARQIFDDINDFIENIKLEKRGKGATTRRRLNFVIIKLQKLSQEFKNKWCKEE